MRKLPGYLKILLSLLLVAAAVVMLMPRTASFAYDYKKGSTWKYATLFAQFDFPLLKTQEQIEAERSEASSVIPYYRYSGETVSKSMETVKSLGLGELGNEIAECLEGIYGVGVVSDEGVVSTEKGGKSDLFYVQFGKRAVKKPVTEVYTLSAARQHLVSELERLSGRHDVDSLLAVAGADNLIIPNLVFDRQTTELVAASAVSNISPTSGFVKAGQLIVSEGEIVTAEIEQMLNSYRKEYNASVGYSGNRLFLWLGNLIIVLSMCLLLFLSISLTNPSVLKGSGYYYILMIFLMSACMALISLKFSEDLLFLMPFTLAAVYLRAFFPAGRNVATYAVTLLPLLVLPHNGAMLYAIFFAGGLVTLVGADDLGKGWRQFLLAFVAFVTMAAVYLGFYLVNMTGGNALKVLMMLFGSSMLSVAGYPLIYLFERIFGFTSDSRLKDLSDTSSPLLRELELKAPGTFQHSLQVMNMADAAARAIGADPLLVRTGALYHDIGKIMNPQCFVENESLINKAAKDKYHSSITPVQSAADIIQHVADGVELAEKNHLPEVVVGFIRSHHGTTPVNYFWNRHLQEGGDPGLEAGFHYQGPLPLTKEQVILMLCDSMEAASRTIGDYTPEAFSAFVENIVDGKMSEGQFEDADISLREIGLVKEAIKAYLAQMHHGRVTYPEKKSKYKFKKK